MKELMIGNKAVARGLYEAGCTFASSYPGTPSTEITEEAAKYDEIYCEWAPNEKVALEAAFGASMAGKRSFCGMKHVGLNVAADPLYSMSYTGVTGGLVIAVADDPAMHSSQNEQDTRRHGMGAKVPIIEPADSEESLEFTKIGFEISEKFDTPIILRMCTRISHSQSIVEVGERVEKDTIPYEKNIGKFVMMPGNAKKRHPIVEQRLIDLEEWSYDSGINKVELSDNLLNGEKVGVITSSTSYQYVKEVFGDDVSVLKFGMTYPLSSKLILEFASKVDKVFVVEELEPVIEEKCMQLGVKVTGKEKLSLLGEYSQNMVAKALLGECPDDICREAINAPIRPPVMCPGCPHRGVFYTLKKNKCIVMGDIGCYTLGAVPPLGAMDMTLDMGASISATHGFVKALGNEAENKTVAVIGDSTFMHSGMTGLADIAYNRSNSTVIILDNSITGMTGQQQNPTTGYNIKGDPAGKIDLEALCKALGIDRVTVVDPYDLKAFDKVLKEELSAPEPSVIITRRPCVLLKYVEKKKSLVVNHEKCTGCGSCMRIGCPAISMKDGKAVVDKTLCIGCDVCVQLCGFKAFEKQEGEN